MSVERTTHYSDPELLAYVDGELSWWRRIRVRRHLEVCWKCRSRAHAQQEEIARLTESLETWEYPGVFWHLDQQLELGRRLRRFEMLNELHRPQPILRRRSTLIAGALLAVIVLACVLIQAPSRSPQAHPVLPTETLAGARNFERKLYQHPVEQTLALEVEHVIPVRQTNLSQVQIWSDAASGRFVSRWTAADGSLKEALWRRGPGQEYLFRPMDSRSAVQRSDRHPNSDRITDFLSPEAFDDLENVFMHWMESRSWTAVSFEPEAAEWMSSEGATSRVESIAGQDGSRQIRLTVNRQLNGVSAMLTVDFDRTTLQPRRMAIQIESGGRVAALRVIAKAVRNIQPSEVEAVLPSREIRKEVSSTPAESAAKPSEAGGAAARFASIDLAERTAEAEFVLHAAGACLGEPVLVEEAPGGVRVRSGKGRIGGWPESITSSANLADVLGALADIRAGPAIRQNPEIPGGASALVHARALRLLAHRFPRTITSALPERSRHLLESMLQSHIEGVRAALGDYDASAESSTANPLPDNWREAAELVYAALSNGGEKQIGATVSSQRVRTLLQSIPEEFAFETRKVAARAELPPVGKR